MATFAEMISEARRRGLAPEPCTECGHEPVDSICECRTNQFLHLCGEMAPGIHVGRNGIGRSQS